MGLVVMRLGWEVMVTGAVSAVMGAGWEVTAIEKDYEGAATGEFLAVTLPTEEGMKMAGRGAS